MKEHLHVQIPPSTARTSVTLARLSQVPELMTVSVVRALIRLCLRTDISSKRQNLSVATDPTSVRECARMFVTKLGENIERSATQSVKLEKQYVISRYFEEIVC